MVTGKFDCTAGAAADGVAWVTVAAAWSPIATGWVVFAGGWAVFAAAWAPFAEGCATPGEEIPPIVAGEVSC